MKKITSALMLVMTVHFFGTAQVITFDGLGYTSEQALGNPYTIINNGETFIFTLSGVTGGPTTHLYRTTDPYGCGNTGHNHLSSGITRQLLGQLKRKVVMKSTWEQYDLIIYSNVIHRLFMI